MSQDEFHKGTITRYFDYDMSTEEQCKKVLANRNVKDFNGYETCEDKFRDEFSCSNNFILVNGDVYLIDDVYSEDRYVCEASKNKNGGIDYVVGFYNGGACLEEMLEEAINKMNKKE